MPEQNGTALLLVAIKTDQPNIERRLRTILAASEPVDPDTEPCVWAKPVEDLVASDLDALSFLLGWDAVSRLRVGDVVSGGLQSPDGVTGTGNGPDSPDTDGPKPTLNEAVADEAWISATAKKAMRRV